MLRPGLIVLTRRGPVELRGRNGCHPSIWWGWPLQGGRPRRNRTRLVTAGDVLGVRVEAGFQAVLPGVADGRA